MVQTEMGFDIWDVLVNCDDDFDVNSQKNITESHCKRYEKMFEEDPFEDDYKLFLSILFKKSSIKPLKKQREKADNEEGTKDFVYGLWLKKLIQQGKSYALEVEQDGLPFLKYEGNVEGFDKGCCFSGYKRKLRNGPRKNYGPSNERIFTSSEYDAEDSGRRELKSVSKRNNRPMNESRFTSSEEDVENSGRRKLRSGGAKSEKMENGKTSTCVTDPEYRVFLRDVKCVEGCAIFEDGDNRVVFEESNGGERNHQRDDEWDPFVEILDRDTFYKEVNSGPSVEAVTDGLDNMNEYNTNSNLSTQLEFRRQLIAVLRKPYDEEEYDKLWEDVKFRKPEKRHLDLRHGRDRSCSTDKYGKSYLDHQPDLENQLSRLDDLENKPKRLNLLRGFFFWLKKASHNGSFYPWKDAECLAINPDSC